MSTILESTIPASSGDAPANYSRALAIKTYRGIIERLTHHADTLETTQREHNDQGDLASALLLQIIIEEFESGWGGGGEECPLLTAIRLNVEL